MRRYIFATLGILALVLSACSLKEPDLYSDVGVSYPLTSTPLVIQSVYTEAYSLGYTTSRVRFQDVNPDSAGVQDEIIVNMSAPFTVSQGGIEVKGVSGKVIGSVDFNYVVNNYEKRITIYLPDIKDSTTYELIIHSANVKDLSGNFLDGNYNGKPDSCFDDFVAYFRGPGNNADIPDNSPVSVTFSYFSDYAGGDAVSSDTLIVWFSRDIDTTSLTGNFALYSYPDGQDYTNSVNSFGTYTAGNIIYFVFNNIPDGGGYVFILKNGIKDTMGRALDGNGNGVLEAEDNDSVFFNVAIGNTQPVSYPVLNGIDHDNAAIILEFSKPMDVSSIGDSTVIVFDSQNHRIYSKLSLYPDRVHLRVEPMMTLQGGMIFLSRSLKDTSGLRFDGNGNGFGGEPGLDDIYVSF